MQRHMRAVIASVESDDEIEFRNYNCVLPLPLAK